MIIDLLCHSPPHKAVSKDKEVKCVCCCSCFMTTEVHKEMNENPENGRMG